MSVIVAAKKWKQRLIHSPRTTNAVQTASKLAWHNSETECHLKMKICTDSYFYETFNLKICYNLDWLL